MFKSIKNYFANRKIKKENDKIILKQKIVDLINTPLSHYDILLYNRSLGANAAGWFGKNNEADIKTYVLNSNINLFSSSEYDVLLNTITKEKTNG